MDDMDDLFDLDDLIDIGMNIDDDDDNDLPFLNSGIEPDGIMEPYPVDTPQDTKNVLNIDRCFIFPNHYNLSCPLLTRMERNDIIQKSLECYPRCGDKIYIDDCIKNIGIFMFNIKEIVEISSAVARCWLKSYSFVVDEPRLRLLDCATLALSSCPNEDIHDTHNLVSMTLSKYNCNVPTSQIINTIL